MISNKPADSERELQPDLTYPPEALRWPPVFPPVCACAWGDDAYGLWIDVQIAGQLQRFRWIEPGEFVMGSPKGEKERYDNEGPQHVVHLTEGYWLAETACSQALWKGVTGNNPSFFKNELKNPVEQVSWGDVDDFLLRLEALLPGVKAALPTEAEWEYACRAGRKTAFSFGNSISPELANYDGRQAFEGDVTGEFRKTTVPIKTFAPNPWGLYQMHGNVWEWCADGQRTYDGASQTDPRGPEGDAPRTLRGGSWFQEPGWLRSAYRYVRERGRRLYGVGFRFSLRSAGPEGPAVL